jgi:hypothetical protein
MSDFIAPPKWHGRHQQSVRALSSFQEDEEGHSRHILPEYMDTTFELNLTVEGKDEDEDEEGSASPVPSKESPSDTEARAAVGHGAGGAEEDEATKAAKKAAKKEMRAKAREARKREKKSRREGGEAGAGGDVPATPSQDMSWSTRSLDALALDTGSRSRDAGSNLSVDNKKEDTDGDGIEADDEGIFTPSEMECAKALRKELLIAGRLGLLQRKVLWSWILHVRGLWSWCNRFACGVCCLLQVRVDIPAAVQELQLLMGPELIEAFEKDPMLLLKLVVGRDSLYQVLWVMCSTFHHLDALRSADVVVCSLCRCKWAGVRRRWKCCSTEHTSKQDWPALARG